MKSIIAYYLIGELKKKLSNVSKKKATKISSLIDYSFILFLFSKETPICSSSWLFSLTELV